MSNAPLNKQETAALIETRDFLRALVNPNLAPALNSELRLRAKAHAAVVNMVVTMKGKYES